MELRFALSIIIVGYLIALNVTAQPTHAQNDSKNQLWLSSSCSIERVWFENREFLNEMVDMGIYSSYTRQKALNARQQLLNSPDWDSVLPCCPETIDIASESPFFTVDNWFAKRVLSCYHPGAVSAIRSSKMYSKVSGQSAGQQCTYDKTGRLIPPNLPGAGTPDVVSPGVSGEQHYFFDVYPWTKLSSEEYSSAWKPDAGCHKSKTFNLDPTIITHVWLYVKRGDIININATGKIKFDVEGNETSPEGSLVIPKTDVGIIGRLIAPNPLPTAKPGALLGGIITEDITSPNQYVTINQENLFFAGKAGDYRMPATGYLSFSVNDGYLQNNSGMFEVTIYRKLAQ